jgi:hypothetical protein
LSPGFFSHLVIVPSTMDSPICGITMSVGIVPFHSAPRSQEANALLYIKQKARNSLGAMCREER